MSFWIVIWLLISMALIGFTVWNTLILFKQKKNWSVFAKKYKLRFTANSMMSVPEINGIYKGHTIGVFSSEHEIADGRGERKMIAIEVEVDNKMPTDGALGTKGMVPIVQTLDFRDEYRPDDPLWDDEGIIRCDDKDVVAAYLEPERIKALMHLARRKNTWLLLIFRGGDCILRIDTSSAMEEVKVLRQALNEMVAVAEVMTLRKGEGVQLKSAKAMKPAGQVQSLALEDDALAASASLTLEDDDVAGDQEDASKSGEADDDSVTEILAQNGDEIEKT